MTAGGSSGQEGRVAVVFSEQPLRDGSGALEVLRMQLQLLTARGWHPVLYVSAPSLRGFGRVSAERRAEIARIARSLGVELGDVTGTRLDAAAWPSLVRLARRVLARHPFGPEADLDLMAVAVPPARTGFAAVVCNNASCLPLAEALAPAERQLLVLHELPAGPMSPRLVAAFGRPHLLALSHDEAERLRAAVPGARVHMGLPVSKPPVATGVAQALSAGVAFDAAGPERAPEGGWQASAWGRRADVDLLFVGGTHPPNIAGITAFIEQCFLPHLAGRGVSLAIAGASGNALGPAVRHEGIAVLGRVRDLPGLYAAAKLVIVPLLSGTGVSIKTVEAAGHGRPILATPAGLRGLGAAGSLALEPPFDRRWADKIDHLLGDRTARATHAEALARAIHGPTLDDSLAHVVETFLAGRCPEPLPARPLMA